MIYGKCYNFLYNDVVAITFNPDLGGPLNRFEEKKSKNISAYELWTISSINVLTLHRETMFFVLLKSMFQNLVGLYSYANIINLVLYWKNLQKILLLAFSKIKVDCPSV